MPGEQENEDACDPTDPVTDAGSAGEVGSQQRHIMLWAACTACFFGFLRSGEITAPSSTQCDSTAHLMVGDVSVNSRDCPTVVRVQIKASKTDPFRKGVTLLLGRTNNRLCPVAAITAYLASRGPEPGPLFRFENGSYLTRESFVRKVRAVMLEAGLEAQRYSGHSFRVVRLLQQQLRVWKTL